MAKTPTLPHDLPTLSRVLVADPKGVLPVLKRELLKLSEPQFTEREEGYRMALMWAWDEVPKELGKELGAWANAREARLRRLAAGAVPLSSPEHGPKGKKLLKKLTADKDRGVRLMAMDRLLDDLPESLELAKRWVKHTDPGVRAMVAQRVRNVPTPDIPRSLEVLDQLNLDPEPAVHYAVASSYWDLYEREPREALRSVRAMAESEDESIRWAAALNFMQHLLADRFEATRATLRSWLRDGRPELRWTLARSILFLTVNAQSLPILRMLFEDKDPGNRARVVEHLVGAFDPLAEHYPSVARILRRSVDDQDSVVRAAASAGEDKLGLDFAKLPEDGHALMLQSTNGTTPHH
ncbi:MAG: HEAT repeat domain-containing protein [Planctomycetota bacterium]